MLPRLLFLVLSTALLTCLAAQSPAAETDALEAYARGDYAGVVKLVEKSVRDGSAGIQEHLLLARAYLHLDRNNDALGVLRTVIERDHENPDANALIGQMLYEAGKAKEALAYLETAHRLKQDAVTSSLLGKCHYALGDAQKAKMYLEQALALDVRDPSNSYLLGTICLDSGSGALAEKYLLQSEEAGTESAELHRLLGRAYMEQYKFVGPVLVRRIPGSPKPGEVVDGHVVLAPLEGVTDQYKVCTRYSALYEGIRLLEALPDDPDGLYMAASGWLAAGDAARANDSLRQLSRHEPRSRRTLDLTARALIVAGDVGALIEVIERGEKAKVFDAHEAAQLYYRGAVVLLARGERTECLKMLEAADKRQPASAAVLRALAELSVTMGRDKQARGYYARLVELFPDASDIDGLRNALQVLEEKTGGAQ
ncbi:MAG: tetratricopeptide repeat protein [Verrucomicrobia bacterium]|nr:tetratricopeptide repeat protein [Verrucomicrobiota bacterium]